MSIFLLILMDAALAALLGFCIAMTQGCLYVGRGISDTGSKTGYQDAVSPPILANVFIGVLVLIIALVIYAFWNFAVWVGFIVAVESVVVVGIGMKVAPKAASPFWVKVIYGSLTRRAADYTRDNDHLRAEAALSLIEMIEARFADKLH